MYHGQLNFRGGDNVVSKATIEKYPSATPGSGASSGGTGAGAGGGAGAGAAGTPSGAGKEEVRSGPVRWL